MSDVDPGLLAGRWVHSHEEDEEGRLVFRHDSYAFPPTRAGRRSYVLQADGSVLADEPGPDDRPVALTGTWALEPAEPPLLRLSLADREPQQLRIAELAPARLVVALEGPGA